MPSKKQRLKKLQGDWTAIEISVSFKPGVLNSKPFISIDDIYLFIKSVWNKELINLQEQFMALYFNRSNKLIGWKLISTGTQQVTLVDVKFLVCLALQCMASSVIVAHNHPSGNLKPSKQDEDVTLQIKKTLKLIDVKLLDHLIISESGYLSMNDKELL
jgi:DNA repair protein RadC